MTAHQIKILRMISLGFSTDQIANEMHLSRNTIKTHRKDILEKMEARNACHAVRLYMQKIQNHENHTTTIDAADDPRADVLDDLL